MITICDVHHIALDSDLLIYSSRPSRHNFNFEIRPLLFNTSSLPLSLSSLPLSFCPSRYLLLRTGMSRGSRLKSMQVLSCHSWNERIIPFIWFGMAVRNMPVPWSTFRQQICRQAFRGFSSSSRRCLLWQDGDSARNGAPQ